MKLLTTNEQLDKASEVADELEKSHGLSVLNSQVWRLLYASDRLQESADRLMTSIIDLRKSMPKRKGSKSNPLRFKDICRRV